MNPPKHSGVSIAESNAVKSDLSCCIIRSWIQLIPKYNGTWVTRSEVPTSDEIFRPNSKKKSDDEGWNDYQNEPPYDPRLSVNIIDEPWPDRRSYLEAHYNILREDAVAPLREAVKNFAITPQMFEDKDIRIYTHVRPTGLLLSRLGPAVRVEFSTERIEKKVRWVQSTRLMQGTLVALSPAEDMFSSICTVATVAARPVVGGLDQNPPTVDLFWGGFTELNIDPNQEWVMIEARGGYFEAYRHTLVGLQLGRVSKFPLSSQIVKVEKHVDHADYIKANPYLDLSSLEIPNRGFENTLVEATDEVDLFNVNVLKDFPTEFNNGMDESQLHACKTMLTNRVAIIQGPPGTGKTFVSVAALKVQIANLRKDDPPIIVAAQTNHAIDQLLTHIMKFESNIVRLGGRSERENEAIRKRTLYELREANRIEDARAGLRVSYIEYQNICKEIDGILSPLKGGTILSAQLLVDYGVLTEQQRMSLNKANWSDDSDDEEEKWSNDSGDGKKAASVKDDIDPEDIVDIRDWLGVNQIVPVNRTPPTHHGLDVEEADPEFDQLQAIKESVLHEDADNESLQGSWIPFGRYETSLHGKVTLSMYQTKIKSIKNFGAVPTDGRADLYRGMELMVLDVVRTKLLECYLKYEKAVKTYDVAKNLCNYKLIKALGIKVIGCTTTGLAKYRPLLTALKPRTLLIEEAAETLEGTIAAGMVGSLEQLILVGDHFQLQASTAIRELQEAPYNMKVSMFQRLIDNSVPFVMLKQQRRMVPEVRKLLTIDPKPFYKGLIDHHSVLDRAQNRQPIPGMGGNNLYFFHHNWPESVNEDASRFNIAESEMLVKFFYHLVINGTEPHQITVLTFYNGQRKHILKDLKEHEGLKPLAKYFKVYTVDSYQGEENDVILLSLVRSNLQLQVGFLASKNRAVVALSRARRGMYIFGNAITLATLESTDNMVGQRDELWGPIVTYMNHAGHLDIDNGLPLVCKNHGTTTIVFEPRDWDELSGGCKEKCRGIMSCGHPCILFCHPLDHSKLMCMAACTRKLDCGHGCSRVCGAICECDACKMGPSRSRDFISDMDDLDIDDKVVPHRTATPLGGRHRNDSFSLLLSPDRSTTGSRDLNPSSPAWTPDRGRTRHRGGHRQIDSSGYVVSNFGPPPLNPAAAWFSPSPGKDVRVALGDYRPVSQTLPTGARHSSPGDTWKYWNAKESDDLLAKQVGDIDDKGPKFKTAINETFVEVDLDDDGKRKAKDKTKSYISPFDGADDLEEDVEDEKDEKAGDSRSKQPSSDRDSANQSTNYGMWRKRNVGQPSANPGVWVPTNPQYRHQKDSEFFEGGPRPPRSSPRTVADVTGPANASSNATKVAAREDGKTWVETGSEKYTKVGAREDGKTKVETGKENYTTRPGNAPAHTVHRGGLLSGAVSGPNPAASREMPRGFNSDAERTRHHQLQENIPPKFSNCDHQHHEVPPPNFDFDEVRERHQELGGQFSRASPGRRVDKAAVIAGRAHRRAQTNINDMSSVAGHTSIPPPPTKAAPSIPIKSRAGSDRPQTDDQTRRHGVYEPLLIDLDDAVDHGTSPSTLGQELSSKTNSPPAVSGRKSQALAGITEDNDEEK